MMAFQSAVMRSQVKSGPVAVAALAGLAAGYYQSNMFGCYLKKAFNSEVLAARDNRYIKLQGNKMGKGSEAIDGMLDSHKVQKWF
jgi:hypothetical protein